MRLKRPNGDLPAIVIKAPTGLGSLYVIISEVDNKPFEVFLTVGKSGTSIKAKAEVIGRLVSLALQYEVPLEEIIEQLVDIGDDQPMPYGDGQIKSIPDAVGKVLKRRYLDDNKAD